jgi:hypothetical protein
MANEHPHPPPPDLLERLSGSGTVYSAGERLMDVDYDLMVTAPQVRDQTHEPGSEPRDTTDITGRLLGSLYTAEPLTEQVNTLVLEDGRSFDFKVIQPETNEIVGTTPLRAAESGRRPAVR